MRARAAQEVRLFPPRRLLHYDVGRFGAPPMTIMTIRIPNDVDTLDKVLEGEDKDAIIAQIIRDGLAVRAAQASGTDA